MVVALAAASQVFVLGGAAGLDNAPHQRRPEPPNLAQADSVRATGAPLRKIISELQRTAPNYSDLEPPLQQAIRQQLEATASLLNQLGPLQRIEFTGTQNAADLYRVTFENGTTTWAIAMSPSSGKIAALAFRSMPGVERAGDEVAAAGLSGTLLKPADIERPPVVLLVAGSGPTDRNGNQNGVGPGGLRQIAEALAEHGIASLRYDKRGIGRSSATNLREEDVTFDTMVKDAGLWLAFLRDRQDVGPVFVAGHSEGGMIAIELAKTNSLTGLILLATPGRRLGDVLREQLKAAGMSASLRDGALTILAALERGESVATVNPALLPLFRPSVQPFLRSELVIDPSADLHDLTLPVLIVSGGHDIQVSEADATLLSQARPDAQQLHLSEMNHMLKTAPADRNDQQRAYTDPSLPLAPDLAPGIISFVSQTAHGRTP